VKEFKDAKFTGSKAAADRFGLCHIECVELCDKLITAPGYIGSAGNSGFQAINLAVHLGASKIVLVGFDMRLDLGTHWHGDHEGQLRNPSLENVIRWRRLIDEAAGELAELGIEVVNASKVSALTAYPIMSLDEALR
jgi:hypothetical protein